MKNIIYFTLFILLIVPMVHGATSISGCIDITSSGDYELTGNIANISTMDYCITIDTIDNVNIDCKGYIVNGASVGGSFLIRDSNNVNLQNCITQAGHTGGGDGIIQLQDSNYSTFRNILMNKCSSVGGLVFNRQIHIDGGINNEFDNITIHGEDCRGELLYLDGSSYNKFNNLSLQNEETGGGDDGAGVYLRLVSNSNIFKHIDNQLSEDGFYIQGSNNILDDVNTTLSYNKGFDIDGDNNSFINVKSYLNNGEGFDIAGDNNSFLNSTSDADYLTGTNSAGLRIGGDYNYFYNHEFSNIDRGIIQFSGNYNHINYSILGVISTQASPSALIKFLGTNNIISDSFLYANSTSPLFYSLGSNNNVYNNHIYTTSNDLILNKSQVYYNYWYVNKISGTPIFPLTNNNTLIGGNYWANETSSYSEDCTDVNSDGFCDSPFIIFGNNATDLYPISDEWEPLGCSPDDIYVELEVNPYPETDVGTYFNYTMRNSYSLNSTFNENCSFPNPNAISFVDCNYNDSLGVEHDFWYGQMNTDVYNGCIALGNHDCNNSQNWQDYFYLTSDTAYRVKLTCWIRDFDGEYLDVDLLYFNFTPGTMVTNITLKLSDYDWDSDGRTCNYYNNASVCVSAEDSYNEAELELQQPFFSCWDWDDDGVYDDAYVSSGEFFYYNVSCPGATGHALEWNTTICVNNSQLKNVDGYAGNGDIKVLVGNQGKDAIGTDTQNIIIYKDDDTEIGGDKSVKINTTDPERNTTIHRKNDTGFVAFNINWSDPLDAVTCIRFTDISITSEKVNRLCVYNDADAKGHGDCDCSNSSIYHGIYDFEGDLENFWYYVDYNYSRYGFEFDANISGVEIYNETYFKTAPRVVNIELVELSGCGDYRTYPVRYVGVCQDGEWDYDEDYLDYGGKCGTCFDNNLSLLIGETDIDYGGIYCGSCATNSDSASDSSWQMVRQFVLSNSSYGDLMNNSYMQNWVPFKSEWCGDAESIIGSINAMVGSVLLMILFLAIGIIVVLVIGFLFIFSFWGGFGAYLMGKVIDKQKKKKRGNNSNL